MARFGSTAYGGRSFEAYAEPHKESRLARHLRATFAVLATGLAASAVGSCLHLVGTLHGGFLWTLAQVACLIGLGLSQFGARADGVTPWRLAMFYGFAVSAGVNVGTWIDAANNAAELPRCNWATGSFGPAFSWAALSDPLAVADVNPCAFMALLIGAAFALASAVYACFFLAAVFAKPGKFLWIGSLINTFFLVLAIAGLGHWLGWVGDRFMYTLYVQVAVVAYACNVLYATSKIAAKAALGDPLDVVSDAVQMLGNFLNILVRVLIILAKIAAAQKKEKARGSRK